MKAALIIIDIQFDFLPGGALAVEHGDEIIPGVLTLLDESKYKWSAVAVSQDWHPKDHCSFASNHSKAKPFEQLEFTSTKDSSVKALQTVWPDHCVQHTHGASFPPELIEAYKKLSVPKCLVQKGQMQDRDFYSAFQDVWDDEHTELVGFLKDNEITDVFLTGLAYDYCVKFSAESAAKLGLNAYVIKSLCKAIASDQIKEIDDYYKKAGVKILESVDDEILDQFRL